MRTQSGAPPVGAPKQFPSGHLSFIRVFNRPRSIMLLTPDGHVPTVGSSMRPKDHAHISADCTDESRPVSVFLPAKVLPSIAGLFAVLRRAHFGTNIELKQACLRAVLRVVAGMSLFRHHAGKNRRVHRGRTDRYLSQQILPALVAPSHR